MCPGSPLRSVHSGDSLFVRVTGSDAAVSGDDVAKAVVSKADRANVKVKGARVRQSPHTTHNTKAQRTRSAGVLTIPHTTQKH